MKSNFIIASRGSKLALWQANFVKQSLLNHFPYINIKIHVIRTTGDVQKKAKLGELTAKGVFTKELEEALIREEADLAVHSLKDLLTDLPEGLELGAVPIREEAQDVLISKDNVLFENLPKGARIGTSSFRRHSQLLRIRPDVCFEEIRGNMNTRIKKVYDGPYDAVVVAKAGIVRLGLSEVITQEFSLEEVLSAVGQAALGIEIRSNDDEVRELLKPIYDGDLFCATSAERAFLRALGGGCRLPIAAYGEVQDQELKLDGLVATPDGTKLIRKKILGSKSEYESLGLQLALEILNEGGREILQIN